MNCSVCGQRLPCPRHSNDERTATGAVLDGGVSTLGDDGSEPTSRRDPLVGRTLGDYEIVKKVGEGGMGVVYEGFQPLLGRRVAIKFVRKEQADTADQIDALLAEARTANLARHRHIIDVFGFGKLEGHGAYLVMEYLEGVPLDDYLAKRGALTPLETIKLLDEVLSALSAAHARGVIHRDLKPSNVFLVNEVGSGHYAKLLDFGLAKAGAAPHGATPQTHSGVIVGTPEYMAPEQALGMAVSPKTDLYAVGIMAFEMLTARLPFPSGGVLETAMHHVNTPAPELCRVDPSVPEPLSDLVGLLLEKNPEDRPDSAEAVRARLKQVQRQLMTATTQNIQAVSIERTVIRKEPLLAVGTPADATARPPSPSPITPVDPTLRPRSRIPLFAAVAAAALLAAGGAFWATRPPATDGQAAPDPAAATEEPAVAKAPPARKPAAPQPPEPKPPQAAAAPEIKKPEVARSTEPRKPPILAATPAPRPLEAKKPPPAAAETRLGTLKIKSTYATASIDGAPVGELPHPPFRLAAGRHTLEAVDPTGKKFSRTVDIKPDTETLVEVRFDGN